MLIKVDLPWNPSWLEQGIGRVKRRVMDIKQRMEVMEKEFNSNSWIKKLSSSLFHLAETQKTFLCEYRSVYGIPNYISHDDWYQTPESRNDFFNVYHNVKNNKHFIPDQDPNYLVEKLDATLDILKKHPAIRCSLQQDSNKVLIKILGSNAPLHLYQIIQGQMLRNPSFKEDGFLNSVSNLNDLLTPSKKHDLNIAMDIALFYGISVTKEIDFGNGYFLSPLNEIQGYVDFDWIKEIDSDCFSKRSQMKGIFAVVRKSSWSPEINHMPIDFDFDTLCQVLPTREETREFSQQTEAFMSFLTVITGEPICRVMTLERCILKTSSELLGKIYRTIPPYKGRIVDNICYFAKQYSDFNELNEQQICEIKKTICRGKNIPLNLTRASHRFAEAMNRDSCFSVEDRILDIVIVFELIFKSRKSGNVFFQKKIAQLLGRDEKEKDALKRRFKRFYRVRNAIIHTPETDEQKQLFHELNIAWETGKCFARRSLKKLLFQ